MSTEMNLRVLLDPSLATVIKAADNSDKLEIRAKLYFTIQNVCISGDGPFGKHLFRIFGVVRL